MNLDEYESVGRARYERLATVVELILRNTLHAFNELLNPPQTQKRAKEVPSLKRKLVERGLEDCNTLEDEIKDLAGCRIVFYTNIDLERFRRSSVWTDDFEVDWRASKTHFPRGEDATAEDLYQGIHYVVRLTPIRTSLAEYADLAGLRCEVQLQTILNHAWSETSHDVLYKTPLVAGFGKRQHEAIKKRFARVMRQHLMLAEYEMQKIQTDVERLRAGLAIFDGAPLEQLAKAKDNNERFDTLGQIREHLIPGLDDLSVHLRDVRRVVVESVEAARTAPVIARSGSLGSFKGATSKDVLRRGLNILNDIRYGYVEDSFGALARLWRGANTEDREKIEEAVEKLAEYNISIWRKHGASAQLALVELVDELGIGERKNIRPLVLRICQAVFSVEMRGSEATSHDQVTFSRATVVMHAALNRVRQLAEQFAMEALTEATTASDWRESWSPLWHGATSTGVGELGPELHKAQLALVRNLVRFVRENHSRAPHDVLQELEENFYWAHRRLGNHSSDDQTDASATRRELVSARDRINCDVQYVRYKTLVGFRTVFVEEWDKEISIAEKEAKRSQRIEALAESVSLDSRAEWFEVIRRCVETDSIDMATFPPLTKFFKALSAKHPAIALDLLHTEAKVERFAPSFIASLVGTRVRDDVLHMMNTWIATGRGLGALARALLVSDEPFDECISALGHRAVSERNAGACFEVAHAALKHGTSANSLVAHVFIPAAEMLTELGDGSLATSFLLSVRRQLSPDRLR